MRSLLTCANANSQTSRGDPVPERGTEPVWRGADSKLTHRRNAGPTSVEVSEHTQGKSPEV